MKISGKRIQSNGWLLLIGDGDHINERDKNKRKTIFKCVAVNKKFNCVKNIYK